MSASADHLKALVQAHAAGDEESFYAVTLQVAAKAARQGHNRLASELREMIDAARAEPLSRLGPSPTPMIRPKGELADLVTADYPDVRLSEMTLSKSVREALDQVLHEQRQRAELESHGFEPIHRVLLTGPPGTGKSMSAAVLAHELGLPLFTIRLDGVISRFMGETSTKLRTVFDAAKQSRAVYLFDEFDAIGAERAAKNDVGEARRMLNSFLLFLDESPPESLVVAATNHPNLLDRALFRRFDSVVTYDLPGMKQAGEVVRGRLINMNTTGVEWAEVESHTGELSHAELVKAAESAAKRSILAGHQLITTAALATALDERRAARRD
ncbi:AAA family ATPase [Actinomadura sp. K4S16]|uniref:AAA family ATPase n=1 Tax=Actinomadura sp. K4S16 TaxID=1316147 RepID=UPI0011EE623D|nr:ATP-binding protein [Actinomadura sp. K4S16]